MILSDRLRQIFKQAQSVCVLTGAGVSAESGVPVFRGGGQTAVWKGMPFDVISSLQMIREDLSAVWEWFDYRRALLRDCQPNPAHYVLAQWQTGFKEFSLTTQNIDGLHQAAGSRSVIELHGNINRARCDRCDLQIEFAREVVPHEPQNCSKCAAPVRPDVCLFGEMLPAGAFEQAAAKAAACDLFCHRHVRRRLPDGWFAGNRSSSRRVSGRSKSGNHAANGFLRRKFARRSGGDSAAF